MIHIVAPSIESAQEEAAFEKPDSRDATAHAEILSRGWKSAVVRGWEIIFGRKGEIRKPIKFGFPDPTHILLSNPTKRCFAHALDD
jgi:hypothetical protein